ncbi:putative protein TPRXL [Passer montanus]|uniref:putative protein TPRXL n=1 Tax=Passer montanus TaxID=9160 RepID=UPI001961CDE8|nr:putative protein TPRXL [Passer montanus]
MGTQNYLWHFVLSVLLSGTLMALEGRDTTTATTASHLNISRSTSNSSRSGPAADSSNGFVAEPHTPAHSLLGTTSLSPSTMSLMGAEGKMNTAPTAITQEGGSLGMSAQSSAASSAFPTAGTITATAPSMGTETGAAASPPLSSATRSHSSSSSSSSSPGGSPAVPPSPQRSSTTQMLSATTSQPPTAPVSSSSSAAGTAQLPSGSETQGPVSSSSSAAGTAQLPAGSETQGPASPRPVPSTSPASATMEARPSPTETRTPQLGPTALPQGQTPTATSPPTGSPSPSTATAGSSATTSPGEEGSTMFQGDTTTTETSRSFPATSLVSMMTTTWGQTLRQQSR